MAEREGCPQAHPCACPFGRLRRYTLFPTMVSNRGASHPPLFLFESKMQKTRNKCGFLLYGGEGGIRTPGRDEPTSDFKSGALNRALPPLRSGANINGLFWACKGDSLIFSSIAKTLVNLLTKNTITQPKHK